MLLAAQVPQAADTAKSAGLTLIESGILGTLLVFAVSVAAFAVWKLNKVQDLRVEDQKKMSERMEGLVQKLTLTFSEMNNSIVNLTSAEKEGQAVMQAMKTSMDGVIMEAVRRSGRSYGPPPNEPRR
jgi:hypothetical protein